jgi:hypothetical protein
MVNLGAERSAIYRVKAYLPPFLSRAILCDRVLQHLHGGVAERGSCGIEAAVPVCRLSPGRGRPYCWAKAQTLRPWQFGFPGVPAKTKKPLSVTSNTVPALFAPPSH